MFLIKTIIIMSLTSMLWWRKNIILLLINLELLMISLFLIMSFFNNLSSSISLLFMLTLMVSGSSIGLSLLVALSRSHHSSNSSFLWNLMFDKIYYNVFFNNYISKKYK